jgi:hypothetical protein
MKTSTVLLGVAVVGGAGYLFYRTQQAKAPAEDSTSKAERVGSAVGGAVGAIASLFSFVTKPAAKAVGQAASNVRGALAVEDPPQGSSLGVSAQYVSRAYSPWAQSLTPNQAPAAAQTRSLNLARSTGIGR